MNTVSIPDEYREHLLRQYDYWISYDDLITFLNRNDSLPIDSYAHARDALARVAWVLAKQNSSITNQDELFSYLENLIDNIEQEGFLPNLGETSNSRSLEKSRIINIL